MALKPKNVRLYLNQENQDMLRELAERVGDLSESQILTLIVSSGLRTLKANGNKLILPLTFAVIREADVEVLPSGRL